MSSKQTPNDFIRSLMGRPVIVRLYSGVDYRGVLGAIDGFMNVALEQTDEYVDGTFRKKYGDCYIRGNNVLYLTPQ